MVVTFVDESSVATLSVAVPNTQPVADGVDTNKMIVVARGSHGQPLSNIPIVVQMPTESATIANPSQGFTNVLGEFLTNITSTEAGEVSITIAVEDTTIIHPPVVVTFVDESSVTTALNVLVSNPQPVANGVDTSQIIVVTRNNDGIPLSNIPIVVQMPAGSAAIANPSQGFTDISGVFTTNITSTEVGEVSITIAVEDTTIIHPPVVVTFVDSP
ncbi:invasin [Beggiatoa sp. PS]|nr:invasin [Beggiatoa sp. PS]